MPKSRRNRTVHLSQVSKKTREHKEKLFDNIRAAVPDYSYCYVFSVDNMRNTYLKDVRHEMSDSRLFFGKTKLMARALGRTPEEACAEGTERLGRYLRGTVGLLFTNRGPEEVTSYLSGLAAEKVDFARAGVPAPRGFSIPRGVVYSTGGEVPAEHDVPLGHTVEPELRRLGVPTRMVKGRVVLEEAPEGGESEPYVVCREGDVLDSRQTRLLKMFGVCMSEFRVRAVAYWAAADGAVTELEGLDPAVAAAAPEDSGMDGVDDDDAEAGSSE